MGDTVEEEDGDAEAVRMLRTLGRRFIFQTPATVNGHVLMVVLDTAAQRFVVSTKTAEMLGLHLHRDERDLKGIFSHGTARESDAVQVSILGSSTNVRFTGVDGDSKTLFDAQSILDLDLDLLSQPPRVRIRDEEAPLILSTEETGFEKRQSNISSQMSTLRTSVQTGGSARIEPVTLHVILGLDT